MTRLELLKKEEELKSVMIREKIEDLTLEMSSLSDTIRSIEQEMEAKDILFLRVRQSCCSTCSSPCWSGVLHR